MSPQCTNVHHCSGPIVSGNIQAVQDPKTGLLTISRVSDNSVLLEEESRVFGAAVGGPSAVTFDFAKSATKLYGMGQNRLQDNG